MPQTSLQPLLGLKNFASKQTTLVTFYDTDKSIFWYLNFFVGKFRGYSHIKFTKLKTQLWTQDMCHMGSEGTR